MRIAVRGQTRMSYEMFKTVIMDWLTYSKISVMSVGLISLSKERRLRKYATRLAEELDVSLLVIDDYYAFAGLPEQVTPEVEFKFDDSGNVIIDAYHAQESEK